MLSALGNFLLGVPNPYVQRRAQDEAINIGVRAGNTAINLGERALDGLTRRALYIIDSLAILGISYSSLNMGSAFNYDYKVCVLQTDGYCAPQLAGTVFFVAIPVILVVQHIKFTKNPVSQPKVQEQETQTDPEEPQSQPQPVVEEPPSLIQQRLLIEDRRVLEDLLEISDENIIDDQIFQKLLDVHFPIQHVQSFRNRASREFGGRSFIFDLKSNTENFYDFFSKLNSIIGIQDRDFCSNNENSQETSFLKQLPYFIDAFQHSRTLKMYIPKDLKEIQIFLLDSLNNNVFVKKIPS